MCCAQDLNIRASAVEILTKKQKAKPDGFRITTSNEAENTAITFRKLKFPGTAEDLSSHPSDCCLLPHFAYLIADEAVRRKDIIDPNIN